MIYRSKPTLVDAVQWTGDNWPEVLWFAQGKSDWGDDPLGGVNILAGNDGDQGWVPVPVGHWIVHQPGDLSDIWPVDDAYFRDKYEEDR